MKSRWIVLLVIGTTLVAGACDRIQTSDAETTTAETKQLLKEAIAEDPRAKTAEGKKEIVLATLITQMLENQHLLRPKIDDEASKKAFKEYLKSIDAAKLYLLESDVKGLEKYSDAMDDQLKEGNFVLAREGGALQTKRVEVVKGMVADILAEPFDLNKKETLETDSDKRQWAKDDTELKERWRKVLKLQAISSIVTYEETAKAIAEGKDKDKDEDKKPAKIESIPETLEGKEKKAREKIANQYSARFARVEQQTHIDRVEQFVNAVTAVLDPHTVYLPPAQKENFDISMSGSLEGIGAVLGVEDHYVKIMRIVPGSASWRQGELEAEDLILMVAQDDAEPVDVVDMRLNDVVRLIRGKKGTTVRLSVKKPDGRLIVIPIVRDIVKIEEAYAKGAVLERKGKAREKVGYIDLPSFYGNTRGAPGNTPQRTSTGDVRRLLEHFHRNKMDAVVLDLRGNGGGLLNDARKMSGLFIEKGPIVMTRSPDGTKKVLEDTDKSVVFDGRVVVMVDRFSASASEILAGALQDYGRAVVVGTSPTHGKGTVQILLSLDKMAMASNVGQEFLPLGVMKLTSQQFYRVSGASTQHRGVVPDITLPDPYDHVESGERFYDYSIPWNKIEPAKYAAWTQSSFDLKALNKTSEKRQASNAAFARTQKRTALFKKRRDESLYDLELATYRADRLKDTEESKALTVELDDQPELLAATIVHYDSGNKPKAKPVSKGKKDRNLGADPGERWEASLSRDPWVDEAILILEDMKR